MFWEGDGKGSFCILAPLFRYMNKRWAEPLLELQPFGHGVTPCNIWQPGLQRVRRCHVGERVMIFIYFTQMLLSKCVTAVKGTDGSESTNQQQHWNMSKWVCLHVCTCVYMKGCMSQKHNQRAQNWVSFSSRVVGKYKFLKWSAFIFFKYRRL